jgi:hypothetical protein
MGAMLSTVFAWIIGSNIAKLFAGVGVAIVSQVFLTGYINDALSSIVGQTNGLPSDVLSVLKMLGFGQFISIIGSAFLTRVSIMQAAKTFGLTVST